MSQRTRLPKVSPLPEFSDDLIDETLALWQPRTARKLTRQDAIEMLRNVTGFFELLAECEAKARRGESADE